MLRKIIVFYLSLFLMIPSITAPVSAEESNGVFQKDMQDRNMDNLCLSEKEVCYFENMITSTNHTQAEAVTWIKARGDEHWGVDTDGNGLWCVDLIRAYYTYLVGYTVKGDAIDYGTNTSCLPSGWTWTNSPAPGDVVVWGKYVNMGWGDNEWSDAGLGHIGLVYSVNQSGSITTVETKTKYSESATFCERNPASVMCYIRPDFGGGARSYINEGNDFYGYLVLRNPWVFITPPKNVAYGPLTASSVNDPYDPLSIYHFVYQPDGSYYISNCYWSDYYGENWYIDCGNGGSENGTTVNLWKYTGSPSQKWRVFVAYDDWRFRFISPFHCDLVMTTVGGSLSPGAAIQLYQFEMEACQDIGLYNMANDGISYSKPSRPVASVYNGETTVKAETPVNLTWNTSDKVNNFDKRAYTLFLTDSSGNSVLTKEGLTSANYTYTFAEPGTYTVKIRTVNTYYKDWYTDGQETTIRVDSPGVNVTDVTLDQTSLTLEEGETATLTATVLPENATNKNVTWTSSDPSIATVNDDGKITAEKAGTATITVTTEDGNKTATSEVTVTKKNVPVSGITLNKSSIILKQWETEELIAKITPENASNKKVVWASDNSEIANCSSTGIILGISPGTTVVRARTEDGNLSASCTVTVVNSYEAEIYGSSLALEGKIGINFYLDISEDSVDDLTVVMAANGMETRVPAVEGTVRTINDKQLRMFEYPVVAKEMRDKVTLTVEDQSGNKIKLTKDGEDFTGGYLYSAADYFAKAEETGTDRTKKLTRVLNNYGKYAQIYFNYNVDDDVLTVKDVSSVTLDTLSKYKSLIGSGEVPGITFAGGSAMLDDSIGYRLYFNLEDGHNISEYTFTIDNQEVSPVHRGGKQYYIEKADIAAKDLGKMNMITITDNVEIKAIRYSALSYAYNALNATGTDKTKLQNMCRAMYLYNQQAIEYFNTKN